MKLDIADELGVSTLNRTLLVLKFAAVAALGAAVYLSQSHLAGIEMGRAVAANEEAAALSIAPCWY